MQAVRRLIVAGSSRLVITATTRSTRGVATSSTAPSSSASAAAPELLYFALRGRAEQIRLLLQETQLPYRDVLLTQAQLRKLKAVGSPISNPNYQAAQEESILPYGGVPVYIEGDVRLSQCGAILQFIAMKGGLFPKDAAQAAQAQMIVLGAEDLFQAYWPIKLDQNRYHYHSGIWPLTPGVHEDWTKPPATYLPAPFSNYTVPRAFRRETLPRWLTYFEALLKSNTSKSGYFVGTELSYADVVLFNGLDAVTTIEPECLSPFPNLAALKKRIESRPRIEAYLKSRPESGL